MRMPAKMLEKHGYTVIEAHTGEEAVEFTKQHRPDLILLDVNLPDFNGFEVCRRVRAMHDFSSRGSIPYRDLCERIHTRASDGGGGDRLPHLSDRD